MRRTLVVIVTLAAMIPLVLVAQPTKPRLSVVTLDGADPGNGAGTWQWNPASGAFDSVWQALVLTMDRKTADAWKNETPRWGRTGLPVIADYDGDGVADLLVVDALGLTVYGQTPAYYPFSQIRGSSFVGVLVADVDGDGRPEVVTQRMVDQEHHAIEVWQTTAAGLTLESRSEFGGGPSIFVLECGDVDNDGKTELITGPHTVVILKRGARGGWDIAAELPSIGNTQDVVRVADVDGDGKNEILATGNGGVLTVYKHRDATGDWPGSYPVLWQSPLLLSEGMKPDPGFPGTAPYVYTQGLAVGDVDNDGKAEILVGTVESGVRPGDEKPYHGGRIHLFKFDRRRDFTRVWLSDWTLPAHIPAFAVADLDGDGRNEFIYEGQFVYKATADGKAYSARPLCPECATLFNAVVGELPELREPTTAVRIVPVRSSLPGQRIATGQSTDVTLTLRSVWAAAKDVTVQVTSTDPRLTVRPGVLRLPAIPAGGIAALPHFALTATRIPSGKAAGEGQSDNVGLQLEIRAAGDYRQSLWLGVTIVSPQK